MKTKVLMAVAAGTLVGVVGIANAKMVEPSQKVLSHAVVQFLNDHGDLCMAKYDWPRDVTAEDKEAQSNDSLQLPVLEQLGIVRSEEVEQSTKRYWLTEKGQRFYWKKKRSTLGVHGETQEHTGDFCVASLTLDKVIKWAPPDDPKLQSERIVSYTYHIKAADWMADPDAKKVFPIVDRIIRGEGKMEMTATVQLQNGKWVPVMPGK